MQMTYPETPVLVWERAVSKEAGANLKGKELTLEFALYLASKTYIYIMICITATKQTRSIIMGEP